jgi:hypothetical protein
MKLTGLTKQQAEVAEILWNMHTVQQVEQFIEQAPPEMEKDIWVVTTMFIADTLDKVDEISQEVVDLLKSY